MQHIERIERKRKIMLGGYLAALLLLVGGQVGAFFIYATAPADRFVGWVFLIPFALVGVVLWGFGRLARAQKK
jgi:cadmium resistance protein CadD (predicted permease)